MRKAICFYCLVFLVSFCTFAMIFPYPVLSRYTNSTENQISKANRFHETEFHQSKDKNNSLLSISWDEGIDILLETNHTYEVYDFGTKQYFFIKRIGGKNHADIIPSSETDFKFICENLNNKTSVPVVLIYNSNTLIPASFSGYMHGFSAPDSDYFGHYCLHFKGSKTDETNNVDLLHQKAIKNARNMANSLLKE